jgi:hypothetical protein
MKTTKKQIENEVKTLKNSTSNSFGQYKIVIDGICYDNFSGHRDEVVSFPENNFDTKLTVYIYSKTSNFTGIQINASTKKKFVDAIYRIVNKKHNFV